MRVLEDESFTFWPWFVANWSRMALPAGIVGALTIAALLVEGNRDEALVALLLPIYMVHQYEEHAHGRFIAFVNTHVGGGLPVLTLKSVFWINILCVWVLFLAIALITRWVSPVLVLIPVYATLLNGIVHIATSAKLKLYNPGVYSSIVLFVPWSVLCAWVWTRRLDHPWWATAIGLIGAVLVHVALIGYAMRRKRALQGAS
jgi:hypothetical protein